MSWSALLIKPLSLIVELTESLVIAAAIDDNHEGVDAKVLLVRIDLRIISI
jgi:hypothetical protein